MGVTIKDVAAAAGVSIATVSRVLANKSAFYAPQTAAKIRQVAKELGYQKNSAAVELVTQKSQVIAVIVSGTKTNFATSIIQGIQDTAFQQNLSVIILYAGENDDELQRRAIQTVIERGVMGILIVALELNAANRALLASKPIPHLYLSTSSAIQADHFVASDDYQIALMATNYLLDRGHTAIGLAGLDTQAFIGQRRQAGYVQALADHGITPDPDWIQSGLFTYDDGVRAMTHWGANTRLTAVIGTSDYAAIGVMNTARDLGRRVPEDLAIISIDGTQLVELVRPQLTSVTQSFYEMGVTGMTQLLQAEQHPLTSKYLPIKLVAREST